MGFVLVIINVGWVCNIGVEIQLCSILVKGCNFSWDVDFNFIVNENIVEELGEGVFDFSFGLVGVVFINNWAIEGQFFGVFYGICWLRDDNGNCFIDVDGYFVFNLQDFGIVGDLNLDWIMGLCNSFIFKGFYVFVLLDICQGGDIYNGIVGVM